MNNLLVLLVVVILFYLFFTLFITDKNIYENIEDVVIQKYEEETFLLFSPKTPNTEDMSYIYQVNDIGETINKYKITDPEYTVLDGFQKKENSNEIYFRRSGNILTDSYLMYDISNLSFHKKNIDFIHNDSGISNIKHHGKNEYLTTVSSHLTGEQFNESKNVNPINSLCNISSEICIEESYESYQTSEDIFEFSNGTILSIRTKNIEGNEKVEYKFLLDFYDKDLNKIHTLQIDDNEICNKKYKIFFSEDIVWIVPSISSGESIQYYGINKDFQLIQKEYYSEHETIIFNLENNVFELHDNSFVVNATVFDENENLVSKTTFIDFQNENLTINFIDNKIFNLEEHFYLHSINYLEKEIYGETYLKEMNSKVIFILDINKMVIKKTIPIPEEIIDSGYISSLIKVSGRQE